MASKSKYRIVRFFFSDDFDNEIVKRGLTLEQAQAHCNDPETSSTTATSPRALALTAERGPWFDGFTDR